MMVDWKYKIFKMEYVQWICKMLKCGRNEKKNCALQCMQIKMQEKTGNGKI